ncbi:hypothetical protein BN135_86 [Cronobacter muytjensii 530]
MLGFVDKLRVDRLFAHQNRDAGALGLIVLAGDIQNIGADNRAGFRQDFRQTVSVIEFIDIRDIAIALFRRFGVANIVNTKTQAFGQVVKAMQFQLFQFLSPP